MLLKIFSFLSPYSAPPKRSRPDDGVPARQGVKQTISKSSVTNKPSAHKQQQTLSGSGHKESAQDGIGAALSTLQKAVPVTPVTPSAASPENQESGSVTQQRAKNNLVIKNDPDETPGSGGHPMIAIVIAFITTAFFLFTLFVWVAQESIFQSEMFELNLPLPSDWLPQFIVVDSTARYVVAKMMTFFLSYPLVFILLFLVYQYLVTGLHWFGSYSAKAGYLAPAHRIRSVAFFAEIAPVFGLMSSLWALMNKGGADDDYVRWVMCGPSFLGMVAYSLSLIYLHWVPQQRR